MNRLLLFSFEYNPMIKLSRVVADSKKVEALISALDKPEIVLNLIAQSCSVDEILNFAKDFTSSGLQGLSIFSAMKVPLSLAVELMKTFKISTFRVLYDSDKDEQTTEYCHKKIDHKGPTLTVIQKGDVLFIAIHG